MSVDQAVLLTLALALPALVWRVRRTGVRGAALLQAGWLGGVGVLLVATLGAHCLDVLSRWYVGTSYTGEPMRYDFRLYALLALGAALVGCGVRLVRAALARPDRSAAARRAAGRTLALVLALVLPLLPVQAVFAVPVSALAVVALGMVALLARAARRRTAVPAAPAVSAAPARTGVQPA